MICLLGLVGLFLAVIPRAALFPILLFIGLVIGAQAFQTIDGEVRPGDRAGHRARTSPSGRRRSSTAPSERPGRTPATVGYDALGAQGVLYAGLERLGAGAVVAGLMLGAIAYFVIAKEYSRAIVYTLIAAVLAFVGLIHDPVGLIFQVVDGSFSVRTPEPVWIGYVFAAIVIWLFRVARGPWLDGRAPDRAHGTTRGGTGSGDALTMPRPVVPNPADRAEGAGGVAGAFPIVRRTRR